MSEHLGPPMLPRWVRGLATIFVRIIGWRVEGSLPQRSKFVMIAAPHTSNWDFIYMLALLGHVGVRLNWMGKHSLFHWPYGWLMRGLGGLSIDRRRRNNVVDQLAQEYAARSQMIIGILPEGTRSKRDHWKTGFYHIARKAEVPIQVCSVDYARKVAVIGPLIDSQQDLETVLDIIREFMHGVQGKVPQNLSDIRVRPDPDDQPG